MAATSFNVASKRLLASVAVHMRLEGAGSSEALVANLTLMFLLRVGGKLGGKLTHHRLPGWRSKRSTHKAIGSRKCA